MKYPPHNGHPGGGGRIVPARSGPAAATPLARWSLLALDRDLGAPSTCFHPLSACVAYLDR